jgi:hypothetical protein
MNTCSVIFFHTIEYSKTAPLCLAQVQMVVITGIRGVNEIYRDSIKANEDLCNLYRENFDSVVRLNRQWSEIFSVPFLDKVS